MFDKHFLLVTSKKCLGGGGRGGGGLMIFSHGGVKKTISGIFDEKVGPFSEFLCLMKV